MEHSKDKVFETVENSLQFIKCQDSENLQAIAEAIALYDLKQAMLDVEAYEDLAIFYGLEQKHETFINI
jgi:hypothetical protein